MPITSEWKSKTSYVLVERDIQNLGVSVYGIWSRNNTFIHFVQFTKSENSPTLKFRYVAHAR